MEGVQNSDSRRQRNANPLSLPLREVSFNVSSTKHWTDALNVKNLYMQLHVPADHIQSRDEKYADCSSTNHVENGWKLFAKFLRVQ